MNCSYQIEISEHQIRPLAAFIPAQQRRLRYQFKIPSSLVQSSSIEPNNLAFHTTVNSLKLIVRFAIYGSICKIEPAKGDNPSVKYFIIPPPFSPSGGGHGGGRPLRLCGYLLWTPLPACREIAAHIPHTSQNILGQNPAVPDLTQSDF